MDAQAEPLLAVLGTIQLSPSTVLPTMPDRGSRRYLLADVADSVFTPRAIAKANKVRYRGPIGEVGAGGQE